MNEELFKLLLNSPKPSVGLEELFKVGALEKLFPELYALTLAIQDSVFHPEKDVFGHHTVWQHTKLTVDQAVNLAELGGFESPRKLCLLLAALYHDVGKPGSARWEFKRGRMAITNCGHDVPERADQPEGVRPVQDLLLERLQPAPDGASSHQNASPRLGAMAEQEVRHPESLHAPGCRGQGEIELVVDLDAADRGGRKDRPLKALDREARWLFKKFEELHVNRETIKPLIMGRDLIAMGVAPGPDMGKVLKRLYGMQLDNEFETRAQGLKAAQEILKGKKR